MNLQELLSRYSIRAKNSVPDWMLGYFKRYSISFANGVTDLDTNVCWLQSRNFTIDLRLPIESQLVEAKSWEDYSIDELSQLANYEGWEAISDWNSGILSWKDTDTSLQIHNRWTEPAELKRFGNCMVECSPSGSYMEDWRLQPSDSGPLIGLRLLNERNLATGEVRHKGGGLIICGEYAGLVLGRGETISPSEQYTTLKDLVIKYHKEPETLAKLFNFETSVAKGSLDKGFYITFSTKPDRIGKQLYSLDGFEFNSNSQLVTHKFTENNTLYERTYLVDTLEKSVNFEQATGFTQEAEQWFNNEHQTLSRYAKPLY